ncbi:hypothetical protein SARC_08677 [Sphaeroforma arctica JP610]|uniref:Uncharacterized protein n=1 Tax=Sphaeroforma arctica JP610 TaxID=667725 RepID=A0A0L0FQ36_9EUKA|nr:hypothetical protein SARC_08677 [Sphaeroforma arctica JP610]KNC78912.1 hypothetical protein SARC_08677 [Sphaeroforma arctica JP610]|eukprot:XP_014152814.1 hypothetical protein SARC_08677 [Sphaeroforma arctica JP610]
MIFVEWLGGMLVGLSFFRIGYETPTEANGRLSTLMLIMIVVCFWSCQFAAGFYFLYDKVYSKERDTAMYRVGTHFITSALLQELSDMLLPIVALTPIYFLTNMWVEVSAFSCTLGVRTELMKNQQSATSGIDSTKADIESALEAQSPVCNYIETVQL